MNQKEIDEALKCAEWKCGHDYSEQCDETSNALAKAYRESQAKLSVTFLSACFMATFSFFELSFFSEADTANKALAGAEREVAEKDRTIAELSKALEAKDEALLRIKIDGELVIANPSPNPDAEGRSK